MRRGKMVMGLMVFLLVLSIGTAGVLQAKLPEEAGTKVTFGYVDWPGVTVKTAVAKQILEYMGYDIESEMYLCAVLYKGLSTNDLDVFLGGWIPTMLLYLEPYFEEGTIEKITINLNETVYTLAVPAYAYDAGCRSEADLHKFADKFGRQIIGIEPGNEGNMIMINAIERNDYNLAGWEVVESSTVGMMVTVENAFKNNDWVVWLGWSPHWMNAEFDMRYLEDPLELWGPPGAEVVWTISRAEFKEDMPNVYKFFEQFKVTPEMQNEWIYGYGREERDADEVAEEWIKNNLKVVDLWVYGVKSVDGGRARDAIREAIK